LCIWQQEGSPCGQEEHDRLLAANGVMAHGQPQHRWDDGCGYKPCVARSACTIRLHGKVKWLRTQGQMLQTNLHGERGLPHPASDRWVLRLHHRMPWLYLARLGTRVVAAWLASTVGDAVGRAHCVQPAVHVQRRCWPVETPARQRRKRAMNWHALVGTFLAIRKRPRAHA
jgi:hypothetical protein